MWMKMQAEGIACESFVRILSIEVEVSTSIKRAVKKA